MVCDRSHQILVLRFQRAWYLFILARLSPVGLPDLNPLFFTLLILSLQIYHVHTPLSTRCILRSLPRLENSPIILKLSMPPFIPHSLVAILYHPLVPPRICRSSRDEIAIGSNYLVEGGSSRSKE